MGETSRAFVIVLIAVLSLAAGWFGRGWWDGSDISTKDSAEQSQDFVTSGALATTTINDAQTEADAANERVRERIKIKYVDRACPPGDGAVSQPVTDRLRSAFAEQGAAGR